jgi:hypothetical protein
VCSPAGVWTSRDRLPKGHNTSSPLAGQRELASRRPSAPAGSSQRRLPTWPGAAWVPAAPVPRRGPGGADARRASPALGREVRVVCTQPPSIRCYEGKPTNLQLAAVQLACGERAAPCSACTAAAGAAGAASPAGSVQGLAGRVALPLGRLSGRTAGGSARWMASVRSCGLAARAAKACTCPRPMLDETCPDAGRGAAWAGGAAGH